METQPLPALAHTYRSWLHGFLAVLLALAAIVAPAQHERMMLGRAAAVAMVQTHGTHTGHGAPADGQHEHVAAPGCFACVLMAAPGLPAAPFAGVGHFAAPDGSLPEPHAVPSFRKTAWSAQHPRAPPAIPS